MSDLADFLAARLDDDERDGYSTHRWDCFSLGLDQPAEGLPCNCGYPARVLREVAAKRAILADHAPVEDGTALTCKTCVEWQDNEGLHEFGIAIPQAWPCRTVRAVLSPWSDHPEFDPGWKPA